MHMSGMDMPGYDTWPTPTFKRPYHQAARHVSPYIVHAPYIPIWCGVDFCWPCLAVSGRTCKKKNRHKTYLGSPYIFILESNCGTCPELSGSYTVPAGCPIRRNPHISWPRPTSPPPHDSVLPDIAPYGEMPHVSGYQDNTRYTWPHISAACHYFDSADDTAKKFYATIMATGVYSGKTHLTPNIRQSAALVVFVLIPSLCSWSSTVRTRGYG